MLTIVDDLLNFIDAELEKRDWTWTELGVRADLSSGTMSNIRTGMRGVGKKTLNGIARALEVPREHLYRLAGLLPPVPERTKRLEALLHLFEEMSDQQKDLLISQARWILSTRD